MPAPGRPLAVLFAIVLVLAPAGSAAAVESGPLSMEILVSGAPAFEYAARGTTYVEALEGREYSVRLTNRTGERVGVALSVDGLNSIDARATTARDARKWILDPWGTIVVSGWQTSSSRARRFYFTTEERSYGAWLGRTAELGVIAAAVFRERHAPPAPWSRRIDEPDSAPSREGRPAGAREAPPAPAPEQLGAGLAGGRSAGSKAVRAPADSLAATGIGREIEDRVVEVAFESEDGPAAILRVRYEYRDALAKLGVLPRWSPPSDDGLARRERARGFREPDFAPDPYR